MRVLKFKGPLVRTVSIRPEDIDADERTIKGVSFSSEEPVERWFGSEILDHSPKSVRLERFKGGAALLFNHWRDQHLGRVSNPVIGADKKGRADIRFAKGGMAEEKWQHVQDGILTDVSFAYIPHTVILEKEEKGKPSTYRVTDWEPIEMSLVTVPADITVGLGRGADWDREYEVEVVTREESMFCQKCGKDPCACEPRGQGTKGASAPAPAPNREAVLLEVQTTERTRWTAIRGAAQKARELWPQMRSKLDELERQFVENGQDVDRFREAVFAEHERVGALRPADTSPQLGLSQKEVRDYRLVRLLRALGSIEDRPRLMQEAAYELEVSRAWGDKVKKDPKSAYIPPDVFSQPIRELLPPGYDIRNLSAAFAAYAGGAGFQLGRDLTVGSDAGGGYSVATNLLAGSFIELLRNASVLFPISTVLSGLSGNIAIPSQTGGATVYWVGEDGSITESAQAFGQLALTPKTAGCLTEYTRKLLIQSSIDIEVFVRMDFLASLGLGIEAVAINGGGSNEPTGILATSGIGDVSLGASVGGVPTWAGIVELETDVAVANAMGTWRYLTNAKARGKLKTTLKDATNPAGFIWDTGAGRDTPLNGYPVLVTNNVPSNLVEGGSGAVLSACIFGNFRDLIIALWSGIDLLVDPYTSSASGRVRVVAFQDVDCGLRHVGSFSAIQDMVTT